MKTVIHSLLVSFLTLGATSVVASEPERPTIPPMGEELSLTNNQPAVDFFWSRKANKECQGRLSVLEKAETDSHAEMKLSKSKNDPAAEIDAKESEWRATRKELLEVVEECGPCVTAEVKKVTISTTGRKEVWYIADGACQFSEASAAIETGYAKAVQSLTKVVGYGKRTGGFDPLIEFLPFNLQTGEPKKDALELAPFPFHVFVGLKGGEIFGSTFAFRHLMEFTWNEKNGDKKETQVIFKAIAVPKNVIPPTIGDSTESGRKKKVTLFPSSGLNAAFYLNSSGYARYYMAGELGGSLPFASEMGRISGRDALYTLYKRFFQ